MTKSEVIEKISIKQTHLPVKDVELSIKHILTLMSDTLSKGDRIEIRGFGSFRFTTGHLESGEILKLVNLYPCQKNMSHILSLEKISKKRLMRVGSIQFKFNQINSYINNFKNLVITSKNNELTKS